MKKNDAEARVVKPMKKNDAEARVVARHRREWDTEQVIRIGDDWFHLLDDGGSKGSRDARRGDGSWDPAPLTEARTVLLGFGLEPAEVARLTDARRTEDSPNAPLEGYDYRGEHRGHPVSDWQTK